MSQTYDTQPMCERCPEFGVGFNNDGEWLCGDCMIDWLLRDHVDELIAPPEPRP